MRKIALLMLLFVLLGNHISISGQNAKFQSLIIYNFTKLLDWPDKSGDFVISVIGNAELAKELKEFTQNRKAGGVQQIVVKKELIDELTDCQIIFVGLQESNNLEKIIERVGNKNILLVTEKNGLTDKGAGVSFVKKNNTWEFQYNETNIKKYGLKVSSDFKVLGIAK